MDLIERYVGAVRRHLPKSANPDIVSELTDNLRSQAEEREAELGRALNEDEQAALLKPHGHPWLMASRYMPQQHLIGPALYPYYRQTLAMARGVPFLRGLAPWLLKDFRSPRRQHPVHQQGWNRKGVISNLGQRKQAFFVLADEYQRRKTEAQ